MRRQTSWSKIMDDVYAFLEAQGKPQRFSKIIEAVGLAPCDISTRNYLTKRLRNWAREGVIERTGRPYRFWYSVKTPELFTPQPMAEGKPSVILSEDREKLLKYLDKCLVVLIDRAYEKGKEDAKSEVKGFFSRIFS